MGHGDVVKGEAGLDPRVVTVVPSRWFTWYWPTLAMLFQETVSVPLLHDTLTPVGAATF